MNRAANWVRWMIRRSWLARQAASSQALWELGRNYVAGQELADAVEVATRLQQQGLELSFTHLSRRESESDTPAVLQQLLAALPDGMSGVEISVKPSSLGLRTSKVAARDALRELCVAAAERSAHVTLEMQRPHEYDAVMALYRGVREDHPRLGITIPVNFRVAEAEVRRLGAEGARVRLCVSSYPAGRDVAIVKEHQKSLALVRCLRIMMESPGYPMLASHDPRIIEIACLLAGRMQRTRDTFEFQMFHGVRPLEHRRLADIGWTSRTCLPFGTGWYSYLATRIAARPRNLWGYARALHDKR